MNIRFPHFTVCIADIESQERNLRNENGEINFTPEIEYDNGRSGSGR